MQRKSRALLSLTLAIALTSANALAQKKQAQPSFTSRPTSGKWVDASAQQLELSLQKLKGLDHFLKTETVPARIASLKLNRAATLTQAARLTLLLDAKNEAKAKKMFRESQSDLDAFKGIAGVSDRSYDDFFITRGLNAMYLGDEAAAASDFESVIVRNPKIDNAGWYALFLVEHYFDVGEHQKCIKTQARFAHLLTPEQLSLSLYKRAWSFINLGQPDEAIRIMIGLSVDKNSVIGQSNILRDIAYILSTYSEPDTVLAAVRSLETKEMRIETLKLLESTLSATQNKTLYRPVIAELARLDGSKSEKFRLALGNLKMERSFYYRESTDEALTGLTAIIRDNDLGPQDKELKDQIESFELELRSLIGTIIDTYNGKAKAPVKVSKPWLAERMVAATSLYLKWFPKTQYVGQILVARSTLCVENQNWTCAVESRRFALGSTLNPGDAEQVELAGLVGLQKTESTEDYAVAIAKFLETYPKSSKWLDLAKSYVTIQIERKKNRDVVKLQEEIYRREPSSENLELLLTNLFTLKEYKQVFETRDPQKDSRRNSQIVALRRDSSLKLAERAKERNEINEYEKWITLFYGLNPSASQLEAARMDHLETLYREKRHNDLLTQVEALSPAARKKPDHLKFVRQSWETLFERAEFKRASSLIDDVDGVDDLRLLTHVAETESLPSNYAKSSIKETSSAAQFIVALAKPKAFPVDDEDKADASAMILARSLLSEIDPSVLTQRELKDFRAALAKIRPLKDKDADQYLTQVRASREKLVSSLATSSLGSRIKALEEIEMLERDTATWIQNSPQPEGLTEQEADLYKKKLAEASKEFDDQAGVYADIRKGLLETRSVQEKNQGTVHAHPASMKKWKWPQVRDTPVDLALTALIEKKRAIPILLIADILRRSGKLVETEYFRLWAGAVLLLPESRLRRELLMKELKKQRQEPILEEWRLL